MLPSVWELGLGHPEIVDMSLPRGSLSSVPRLSLDPGTTSVSPAPVGMGRTVAVSPSSLFWRLCRLGTQHRKNSLTVRSAGCRVPREGRAWGSFVLQLERGVRFQQRAGLGKRSRRPALAVRGASPVSQRADSFLSRAGGPRDRSPLFGLGGERPKGGRQSRRGLLASLWPDWDRGRQWSSESIPPTTPTPS